MQSEQGFRSRLYHERYARAADCRFFSSASAARLLLRLPRAWQMKWLASSRRSMSTPWRMPLRGATRQRWQCVSEAGHGRQIGKAQDQEQTMDVSANAWMHAPGCQGGHCGSTGTVDRQVRMLRLPVSVTHNPVSM